MSDTKSALTSTTIWGAVAAGLGAVAPFILSAVGVTATEQSAVATATGQVVSGLGALVAVIGRLRATKRLT